MPGASPAPPRSASPPAASAGQRRRGAATAGLRPPSESTVTAVSRSLPVTSGPGAGNGLPGRGSCSRSPAVTGVPRGDGPAAGPEHPRSAWYSRGGVPARSARDGSGRDAAGPGRAGAPGEPEGTALPARRRPPALRFGLARPSARRCGYRGTAVGAGELAPVEGPWGLVAPPLLRAGRGAAARQSPSSPSCSLFSRAGTVRRSSAHPPELAGLFWFFKS